MVGKLRISQTGFGIRIVTTAVLALLISAAVFAQARPQKPAPTPQQSALDLERMNMRKGIKPPTGPTFYISPVEGTASNFSVLLADADGNTVAGTFTLQQIEVFEAVLEAAKTFAMTNEKVGSSAPITTRLMEQHEWSLFVDVSKVGDKSRFFISLITPQGRVTAPAGEITRDSKKEQSALLLDALVQVTNARAALASR